jgi:hypothetical protein
MRLLCWVLALLLAPALALAQPALPAGWKATVAPDGVLIVPPDPDPTMRIALTLLPVVTPQQPVAAWFGDATLAFARTLGTPTGASQVAGAGALLSRAYKIRRGQIDFRAVFFGYAAPHGYQVAALLIPPKVADDDPRLQTATDYVASLAAAHFEVAAPAGAAGVPVGGAGAAVMAQMPPLGPPPGQPMYPRPGDPIMQPRPQLPPDRDVPVKGAWFMTGIAFGAVNAGVGGSAYGSHAVQQLLILYANGVAVKADIFGNNLAGHHQAEGFATLDVTDPAVVGQGGFGRWRQQGQTISIAWNYAPPEVLTQAGESLAGGGVTYNPWRLADGVRLQGAFVRDMGPGLRSQGLVLTQDGSFAADGVNVTMGAELVMPAFPARGYGTYEIKKGSLVLRFANGFAVAIACVIDGNTLLLNNFPFVRVR